MLGKVTSLRTTSFPGITADQSRRFPELRQISLDFSQNYGRSFMTFPGIKADQSRLVQIDPFPKYVFFFGMFFLTEFTLLFALERSFVFYSFQETVFL